MDVGKRHSGTADNGRWSPVYLAGIQKKSVPAGESVTRSAALTITRPTEPPRQQSRPSKSFSERRLRMEALLSTPSALASCRKPRTLTGSAHPSCFLGAIFGRKCCHTPVHSSRNGVSGGMLWTEQPQRSQLKPRRNTTCVPSPCRFSNQAPPSGCNTGVQSVGTRSQKWWSASLARAQLWCQDRERLHALVQPPLPAPLLSLSRRGVRLDLVLLP